MKTLEISKSYDIYQYNYLNNNVQAVHELLQMHATKSHMNINIGEKQ